MRDSCKKYYISDDVLVVHNRYNKNFFAYHRLKRERIELNKDTFWILKMIYKKRGILVSEIKKYGKDVFKIICKLKCKGFITHVPTTTLYNIKETKTSFIRSFIEVTEKCNLKCKHCYGSFGLKKEVFIPIEKLKQFIEELSKLGIYRFDLTGGEVMLYPYLEELLEKAYNYGMIVTIFSNLTILPETKLELLKKYRVKKIITSIESMNPNIHDEFRGVKGAFKMTTKNLKRIKDIGIEQHINLVLGKHNIKTSVDTLRYFREKGYSILIDFISEEGRAINNDLSITEYLNVYKKLSKNISDIHIDTQTCGIGNRMFFITAKGDICLCPSLRETPFVFANLSKKFSLKKVLNQIIKKYSSLCCKEDCPVKDICNGGCRARAFKNSESLYGPYKPYCAIYKGKAKDAVC